jgi:hypothetical protein
LNLKRGELIRYIAELAWAPDAILQNSELHWRKIGPDSLVVSAGRGDKLVEVTLTLNGDGYIGGHSRWIDRERSRDVRSHTQARSVLTGFDATIIYGFHSLTRWRGSSMKKAGLLGRPDQTMGADSKQHLITPGRA